MLQCTKVGGGWRSSRFEEGCITFEMLVYTSWRCQEEGWLLESAAEDEGLRFEAVENKEGH